MSGYESLGVRPATTMRGALKVALAMLLLTAFMIVGGIAMVAALGRQGDAATWARWGNVGQTFEAANSVVSAFAIGGILISWAFQAWQMQFAQLALQRSVDAEVRDQHVTLMHMAINDPDLAAVWPNDGGKDQATQRQYFYANLLVQHVWLQHTTGIATHDEMVNNLKYLFASPIVRAFWRDTANSRHNIYVEGTAEQDLDAVATAIWNEYEAVLACSPENNPRPRERRAGERPRSDL
ncbi:DUF6082 family protein [Actinoplanes sp. NPDC051411]|uniref:DUF6082 family protein n=1 Tax=Actinoplanes sp. NPDC051411 TaxID=3155522 RepID=UPI00341234FC